MFKDKYILAPMVRVGCLPFRLTCLEFGADLVYAQEVIAQRLLNSTKLENKELDTTDFLDEDGSICFRTSPAESDKVVFQMGVSDPEIAAKAAKMVEPYVAGIDVNMGCPKSYSISGNMGAALLTQPDLVENILKKLTETCSKPVTCKIRILPEEKDTLELCKLIESTGVAAITVHGRTRYTRSSAPCQYDIITKIKQHLKIPVILNGASLDIRNRCDMRRIVRETGVDSLMVARAAWQNPSIFREPEPLPVQQAVKAFLKHCVDLECPLHLLKYTMGKFRGAFKDGDSALAVTRYIDVKLIYQYFGLGEYYDEVKSRRGLTESIQEAFQKNKRQKVDPDNNYSVLKADLTSEVLQSFRGTMAPKQILNQWLLANGFSNATFYTTEQGRIFTGYLKIDNDTYVMEGNFKNKKLAIQAVAYAYMMKESIEFRHYKTGINTNKTKKIGT